MSHFSSAPANAPANFNPFAEPTKKVRAGWISLFAVAWLGIWMAQLTPVQLLLPLQIDDRLKEIAAATNAPIRPEDWINSVVAFGIISGIAGFCALITYPVVGALSDRTVSSLGRRRPWILAGIIVFAVALVLLGLQNTMVGIGIFWSLAIIGFCMLSAAITATISDQVVVNQRGFISAWISAPQAIGIVLGISLVQFLALPTLVGYALVAALLVLLALPFMLFVPDERLPKVLRPPFKLSLMLKGLWINPIRYPDFGWTLLGRILVNLGNALGTTLLLYFLLYGLHRVDAPDDLLLLTVVYLIFFVLAALLCGRLSDMIGRRKPFVYAAAYLQGIAALMLAFIPNFFIAGVSAALLGLGYGCYMSVDQALATQVLPSSHSRGKDLGIMNIATAVPQAVAPLIGAGAVVLFAGFQGLFVASAIAAVLGGLAVIPIKGVK